MGWREFKRELTVIESEMVNRFTNVDLLEMEAAFNRSDIVVTKKFRIPINYSDINVKLSPNSDMIKIKSTADMLSLLILFGMPVIITLVYALVYMDILNPVKVRSMDASDFVSTVLGGAALSGLFFYMSAREFKNHHKSVRKSLYKLMKADNPAVMPASPKRI